MVAPANRYYNKSVMRTREADALAAIMRRLALSIAALVVVALVAGRAAGQGGQLMVSAHPLGLTCDFSDTGQGEVDIYVVHSNTAGSTGARFRVAERTGVTMTYVSETSHFPMTFGNTRDGITICYGSCLPSPILLVTLRYIADGTSTMCSFIEIDPYPGAAFIEALDCQPDGPAQPASCGRLIVNGNVTCGCLETVDCTPHPEATSPRTPFANFCVVPVEDSTWGAIKALFESDGT